MSLELVCIDFWSAEDSSSKSLDVLVMTYHFNKLAQAYFCPNQLAKAAPKQLWDNHFSASMAFQSKYIQIRELILKADLLQVSKSPIQHHIIQWAMGQLRGSTAHLTT